MNTGVIKNISDSWNFPDTRINFEEIRESMQAINQSLEKFKDVQSRLSAVTWDFSKLAEVSKALSSFKFDPFETLTSIGDFSSEPSTIQIDNSSTCVEIKETLSLLFSHSKGKEEDIDIIEGVFSEFLGIDRDEAMQFMNQQFVDAISSDGGNINLQVTILRLICRYSYSNMCPEAPLIAASGLNSKSLRVQSATFDVFDHWSNLKAYNMLENLHIPDEPWLRMKFEELKESIAQKYALR